MGKRSNKQRRPQRPKQNKYASHGATERVPTVRDQLREAKQDDSIMELDLHGYYVAEVEAAISKLFEENAGGFVRIMHGQGTGAVATEVKRYLNTQMNGKKAPIEDYVRDSRTHSIVVKLYS